MSAQTCFDDLSVGKIFRAGPLTISREEMIRFARANDPQYFHIDDEAATDSMFGGLIGSGWQTAALSMRLLIERARFAGGVVGATADVQWPRPMRPGDSISIESEVIALKPSRSRAGRGVATFLTTTFNQHGEVVQTMAAKIVVFTREGARVNHRKELLPALSCSQEEC